MGIFSPNIPQTLSDYEETRNNYIWLNRFVLQLRRLFKQ